MKIFSQGMLTRRLLIIALVVMVIAILYLPLGLAFLTVPEQVFVVSFLVFFILYSNVIAGFMFLNTLLSKIDKEEDVDEFLKPNLSLQDYFRYVVEGELLLLSEEILFRLKERTSILFNIVLVFLFSFFVLYLINVLPEPVFYAAVLPALTVTVIVWGMESYIDLKFIRIFVKEIEKFYKLLAVTQKVEELEEALEQEEEEAQQTEESSQDSKSEENKKSEDNK